MPKHKTMEDTINAAAGQDVHVAMASGDDFEGKLEGVYADLGEMTTSMGVVHFRLSHVSAFMVHAPEPADDEPADAPAPPAAPAP